MNESQPRESISVEQLLAPETGELTAVFADLRSRFDVSSPDNLPEDDDEVADALEDQAEWTVLVDKHAERIGTKEAEEEANFLKSAFFVSAGFTDRAYLAEVLDWLTQDEHRVSQMGLDSLAARIGAKIQEILSTVDQT